MRQAYGDVLTVADLPEQTQALFEQRRSLPGIAVYQRRDTEVTQRDGCPAHVPRPSAQHESFTKIHCRLLRVSPGRRQYPEAIEYTDNALALSQFPVQRQGLLEQRSRPLVVSPVQRQGSQIPQRVRYASPVTNLPVQPEALFVGQACTLVIALRLRYPSQPVKGPGARGLWYRAAPDSRLQVGSSLAQVTPRVPEEAQGPASRAPRSSSSDQASAALKLSCSCSRRSSHSTCRDPLRPGSASSARARKNRTCRCRMSSSSPPSPSFSEAYCLTGSSSLKRAPRP